MMTVGKDKEPWAAAWQAVQNQLPTGLVYQPAVSVLCI